MQESFSSGEQPAWLGGAWQVGPLADTCSPSLGPLSSAPLPHTPLIPPASRGSLAQAGLGHPSWPRGRWPWAGGQQS